MLHTSVIQDYTLHTYENMALMWATGISGVSNLFLKLSLHILKFLPLKLLCLLLLPYRESVK